MSAQITVTLPEDVLATARLVARRSGREVNAVLAETIELAFRPLGEASHQVPEIASLADSDLLSLVDSQLPADADARLTELLGRQQDGLLIDSERGELMALMEIYQDGLLRKAQATREAVRRGLRGRPES